MAKTTTLPITQTINQQGTQFTNSTGASGATLATNPSNTLKIFTAGSEGSVVKALIVSSDDTATKLFTLYASPDAGTTKYWLASILIAITAGQTGAIANVDILGSTLLLGLPLDPAGKPVLPLKAAWELYGGFQAAITSGKLINVLVTGEDY